MSPTYHSMLDIGYPKERATKWNDGRICASNTLELACITYCLQLESKRSHKIIFVMFADKGKHSRVRILVSVSNSFISFQKSETEQWSMNSGRLCSFFNKIWLFSWEIKVGRWWWSEFSPEHTTSERGTVSRNPMPQMVPSGALEKNILVIPFWAHFLRSTESWAVCGFRTLGPDLNIKVFVSPRWFGICVSTFLVLPPQGVYEILM